MNHSSALLLIGVVTLCIGCKEKPAQNETTPPAKVATPENLKPIPFVPPADSVITSSQIMAWGSCNPLLDSLTFRYADSFKTEDPAALLRYQEDFIAAQEKICVRAGLSGGYQEYKWILQNMGIEKNRTILESAHAQTF